MTPEQYALQQTLITAAVLRVVQQFGRFVLNPLLTVTDWVAFLRLLFPEVRAARERSAVLARDFYDFQRAQAHPELPRLARQLERYEFSWFVEALEPAREVMSRPEAGEAALGRVAAVVAREVETAGRRQIIHAVRADKPLDAKLSAQPVERVRYRLSDEAKADIAAILESGEARERPTWGGQTVEDAPLPFQEGAPKEVRGWARVATGRETCAFCLMLISRGPVYYSAGSAGVDPDLPEEEVVDMFRNSRLEEYFGDIKEFMPDEDAWHTGCDCKVVPVFDLENWFGLKASQRAFAMWKKASEKAEKVLEADPNKRYYSAKDKEWLPTTLNREAMNQLRLMLTASSVDWAALRAA